jgi:SAM-dependent methyltransferase
MGGGQYDRDYFARHSAGSRAAAEAILPLIWPIARPASIVDLGCGTGAWLEVARRMGASEVLGLDFDGSPAAGVISSASFRAVDLEGGLPELARKFDLAICVEVLEHVTPSAGERAVAWLCRHAPLVVFSAAVPLQGGRHHVNEQWLSTWAKPFRRHDFAFYDLIRPRIWGNEGIPFWYRQNTIIAAAVGFPALAGIAPTPDDNLDVIHPDLWRQMAERYKDLQTRTPRNRLRQIAARLGWG